MQCATGIHVQVSGLRRACGRCFAAQPIPGRRISHRGHRATVKAVESETKSSTSSEDNDSPFEKQLKSRRKKQKKTSVQDLQPDALPAAAKPDRMSANDQLESSAVLVLIALFVGIIGQGLFLAVSGFLPESWDQFAQDVVYKTFSPTVGVFLASSAAYGVWKVAIIWYNFDSLNGRLTAISLAHTKNLQAAACTIKGSEPIKIVSKVWTLQQKAVAVHKN